MRSASAPTSAARVAAARSLSMTASIPLRAPLRARTTGTPPPPEQITQMPSSTMSTTARQGAGHDAAPAPSGVLAHGEPLLQHHLARLDLTVEGAHGLGWVVEGLVLGVHGDLGAVSYTHLRAHETDSYLVCRLLLEKKKK